MYKQHPECMISTSWTETLMLAFCIYVLNLLSYLFIPYLRGRRSSAIDSAYAEYLPFKICDYAAALFDGVRPFAIGLLQSFPVVGIHTRGLSTPSSKHRSQPAH